MINIRRNNLVTLALIALLIVLSIGLITSRTDAQINQGKFCNVHKDKAWGLWITDDPSSDPCAILISKMNCQGTECKVVSSGNYFLTGNTQVKVSCEGFQASFSGTGDTPFGRAYDSASNPWKPSCIFQATSSVNPDKSTTPIGLFQKPFSGDFFTSNLFDHDIPKIFEDKNGYLTNWQGKKLPIGTPGALGDGHNGYDWGLPMGTPLLAVADGTVAFAGSTPPSNCPPLGKTVSGLVVTLNHTAFNGKLFQSVYVHLNQIFVKGGDSIRAGQLIGVSGNSGCSTGPHLHFGVVRVTGTNNGLPAAIDPYGWKGSGVDPWAAHPDGATSITLWKNEQAPRIFSK